MGLTCIELRDDYGFAIIVSSLLAFQCLVIGFIYPSKARKTYFDEKFLEQFQNEHKQQYGFAVSKGGYPDMGSGRYAQQLPYKSWVQFNKAQRVHYNYLEQVAAIVAFTLLGGLYNGIAAGSVGLGFFVGRILYTIFYMKDDGSANPVRIVGAILGDLTILAQFVLSILAGLKWWCVI